MIRNVITALMKRPYWKRLPLTVKSSSSKSGWPPIAAISGVTMLATKAAITAPKAVAMMTATASATTSPFEHELLEVPDGVLHALSRVRWGRAAGAYAAPAGGARRSRA